MKRLNFCKTPLSLAITAGLLLAGANAQAANPNEWGRWDPTSGGSSGSNVPLRGFAKVADVGGQLVITDDPGSILGDHPGLVNGLDPSLPADTVALHPGDWVLYGNMPLTFRIEFDGGEERINVGRINTAVQGDLRLRPETGQLGVNYNTFIADGGEGGRGGGRIFGNEIAGGQVLPVSVAYVASDNPDGGEGIFSNPPMFTPFIAGPERSDTEAVVSFDPEALADLLDIGIEPGELAAIPQIHGQGRIRGFPPCCGGEEIFFLDEGEGEENGLVAEGGMAFKTTFEIDDDVVFKFNSPGGRYIAGQPKDIVDIAGLEGFATYSGWTFDTGFYFEAEIDLNLATFDARFDNYDYGYFGVEGNVVGAHFAGDDFTQFDGGEYGQVTDAALNGTLFDGALGGTVIMDIDDYSYEDEVTRVDTFSAMQEGEGGFDLN